jgi:hypothetical protein
VAVAFGEILEVVAFLDKTQDGRESAKAAENVRDPLWLLQGLKAPAGRAWQMSELKLRPPEKEVIVVPGKNRGSDLQVRQEIAP